MKQEELPQRKNLRWKNYDYSLPGHYFMTIVINERKCLLGTIEEEIMHLSEAGKMINETIITLPQFFPGITVCHHVVMPNHIHLLILNNGQNQMINVMNSLKTYTTNKYIQGVKENGWPRFHQSLWQRSYYDHVVRDATEFEMIADYIYHNPIHWNKDTLNPSYYPPGQDTNLPESTTL